MMRHRLLLILVVTSTAMLSSRAARADAVTLRDSPLPITQCTIEGLRNGRVHYLDASGRRVEKDLLDVNALSFDGFDALDAAEQALARGDEDIALLRFLQAALNAKDPLHRLWVHARLSQFHADRNDIMASAAHAAHVFILAPDDPGWRILEPLRAPGETPWPVAMEAHDLLARAKRQIRRGELVPVIDRMINRITPAFEQAQQAWDGPDVPAGSTISGYLCSDVERGVLVRPFAAPDETTPSPAPRDASGRSVAEPGTATPRRDESTSSEALDADTIDRLLEQRRFTDARQRCARIAQDPGDRSLSRFLYQYGTSLNETQQYDDAAVMYARCVIHYPTTVHADESLIALAILYRDHYAQPHTCRRLLTLCEQRTTRDDIRRRVRDLLSTPETEPTPP
jgi:TolA-binding protein